jgi:hypothetical protein
LNDFDAFYAGSYARTFRAIRLLCASGAEAEDAVAGALLGYGIAPADV